MLADAKTTKAYDIEPFWSSFIPATSGSANTLEFLSAQLTECLNSHKSCREAANSHQRLPSRLLWLAGPDHGLVYLTDSTAIHKLCGDYPTITYATLSHCWGASDLPRLTKFTSASLADGTAVADLPNTFQQAIQHTRAMNVAFLWIDSLCIFQDDLEDWGMEARAMCDIYQGAIFNIAATGASNSMDGLFFERSEHLLCPIEVDMAWLCDEKETSPQPKRCLVFPRHQWIKWIEQSQLNRRAWVMQERFLSTRVMHFSKSQVFWECLEVRSSEIFPKGLPRMIESYWIDSPFEFKRMARTMQKSESVADMYDQWREFRVFYTFCQLSLPKDRLIAIQGVAEHVARRLGLNAIDDFVAGLWIPDIHRELCWYVVRPTRTSRAVPWRAPSWSWASVDGQVYPESIRHHRECEKVSHPIAVLSVIHEKDWSGKLLNASLRAEGRISPAVILIEIDTADPRSTKNIVKLLNFAGRSDLPTIVSSRHPLNRLVVTIDIQEGIDAAGKVENVFMLPILRCPHEPWPKDGVCQKYPTGSYLSGLILRHNSANTFECIGHFEASWYAHDYLYENLPKPVRTITII